MKSFLGPHPFGDKNTEYDVMLYNGAKSYAEASNASTEDEYFAKFKEFVQFYTEDDNKQSAYLSKIDGLIKDGGESGKKWYSPRMNYHADTGLIEKVFNDKFKNATQEAKQQFIADYLKADTCLSYITKGEDLLGTPIYVNEEFKKNLYSIKTGGDHPSILDLLGASVYTGEAFKSFKWFMGQVIDFKLGTKAPEDMQMPVRDEGMELDGWYRNVYEKACNAIDEKVVVNVDAPTKMVEVTVAAYKKNEGIETLDRRIQQIEIGEGKKNPPSDDVPTSTNNTPPVLSVKFGDTCYQIPYTDETTAEQFVEALRPQIINSLPSPDKKLKLTVGGHDVPVGWLVKHKSKNPGELEVVQDNRITLHVTYQFQYSCIHKIEVEPTAAMKEVRAKLALLMSVDAADLRLACNGKWVDDDKAISNETLQSLADWQERIKGGSGAFHQGLLNELPDSNDNMTIEDYNKLHHEGPICNGSKLQVYRCPKKGRFYNEELPKKKPTIDLRRLGSSCLVGIIAMGIPYCSTFIYQTKALASPKVLMAVSLGMGLFAGVCVYQSQQSQISFNATI